MIAQRVGFSSRRSGRLPFARIRAAADRMRAFTYRQAKDEAAAEG
ncbi:MAG: hypothetical protein AVDCRST_MAG59-3314 [uncultured Thermomicrobiales bacterium]|uniref:Uncharacterized protein n=1 Tax=uncultured Thermomicrobiales bacterium TaxID=1645740 RepID=A0A6J4V485_9BACT|nr:MAG: hypothetical protein AVDCRST_MAG59-3314 [uncultured Thermomicrobiales bacterium]